jgi:hypothetical protein
MKQTIYYCDHCGKIINNMTDYVSAKLDMGAVGMDCDLCEECHAKLVENIKKFIEWRVG